MNYLYNRTPRTIFKFCWQPLNNLTVGKMWGQINLQKK